MKYLTCRAAMRKKGMVRTRMDAAICFAFVGNTFELIENIAFGGGSEILDLILRVLSPAHFLFGVVMGYYYGKYMVTGKKGYHLPGFLIPVAYHSLSNGFMVSMEYSKINDVLVTIFAFSYIPLAVLTVFLILRWQKNRTLDVPALPDIH